MFEQSVINDNFNVTVMSIIAGICMFSVYTTALGIFGSNFQNKFAKYQQVKHFTFFPSHSNKWESAEWTVIIGIGLGVSMLIGGLMTFLWGGDSWIVYFLYLTGGIFSLVSFPILIYFILAKANFKLHLLNEQLYPPKTVHGEAGEILSIALRSIRCLGCGRKIDVSIINEGSKFICKKCRYVHTLTPNLYTQEVDDNFLKVKAKGIIAATIAGVIGTAIFSISLGMKSEQGLLGICALVGIIVGLSVLLAVLTIRKITKNFGIFMGSFCMLIGLASLAFIRLIYFVKIPGSVHIWYIFPGLIILCLGMALLIVSLVNQNKYPWL